MHETVIYVVKHPGHLVPSILKLNKIVFADNTMKKLIYTEQQKKSSILKQFH